MNAVIVDLLRSQLMYKYLTLRLIMLSYVIYKSSLLPINQYLEESYKLMYNYIHTSTTTSILTNVLGWLIM